MRPFHLAFPVTNIEATRHFYGTLLGCKIGRESPNAWIDFDLFGHQLSAHLKPSSAALHPDTAVDGDAIPVPHFGVILEMSAFSKLAERLLKEPSVRWKLKPKTRFEGQPGEQSTLFIFDPSGNALEFKAFADDAAIFAH